MKPISKSERFVREHYPQSSWIHYLPGYDWVIVKDMTIAVIGEGQFRLEAWRDAARNIRNSLKQTTT